MGIDVYWKDEFGNVLAEVGDEFFVLADVCEVMFKLSGYCLRFVDPAGDACFNQQQLPFLLDELRILQQRVPSPAGAHVAQVIELVQAAGQSHTYVWFIGD